ncbi:MAG: NAD(P)H-dependent oxidoreductase [Pseudomonadota bacterium]
MTQILFIQASPRAKSIAHNLADQLLCRLQLLYPDATVTTRDLIDGIPLVTDASIAAMYTPADQRTAAQQDLLKTADTLIDEITSKSDILVIATPMHNWGMPAALKAWFDWVVQARQTFRYLPDGSGMEGLLQNRKTYLILVTGGTKLHAAMDFMTPHILFLLNTMGIKDIEIVAVDGTGLPNAAEIIQAARDQIEGLRAT